MGAFLFLTAISSFYEGPGAEILSRQAHRLDGTIKFRHRPSNDDGAGPACTLVDFQSSHL